MNTHHTYLAKPQKPSWYLTRSIWLLWLSLLFLIGALLPLSRWTQTTTSTNEWADVMIALDVSKSMLVRDQEFWNQQRTRLDSAKQQISQLVEQFPQHRYGLIVFAGDATSITPLTSDHNTFLTFLAGVNHQNISAQWTNMRTAISAAADRFQAVGTNERGTLLVVYSDGEDQSDSTVAPLWWVNRDELWGTNTAVRIIWIGTDQGWPIIEWTDLRWRQVYTTFQWQVITSRRNESSLQWLARSLDGDYQRFEDVSMSDVASWTNNLRVSVITNEWVPSSRPLHYLLLWWAFLSLISSTIIKHRYRFPLLFSHSRHV